MHHDMYKALVNDRRILRFGNILLTKFGFIRKNDIAQSIRKLTRLKIQSKSEEMDEIIQAKSFDTVISNVQELCAITKVKEGINTFQAPGVWDIHVI